MQTEGNKGGIPSAKSMAQLRALNQIFRFMATVALANTAKHTQQKLDGCRPYDPEFFALLEAHATMDCTLGGP